MDVSAALSALQSGDLYPLVAALDWDEAMGVDVGGDRVILARKGTVTVKATTTIAACHDHVSVEAASACLAEDMRDAVTAAIVAGLASGGTDSMPDTVAEIGWA